MTKPIDLIESQKTIFFAYQGRSKDIADNNVEAIRKAAENYNHFQKTYLAKTWEDFRRTTVISREILKAIDDCEIFVCDLTYFNHNVLFELGYAISKDKKILILLNENIVLEGRLGTASFFYKNFILKDILYTAFTSSKEIHAALQSGNYQDGLLSKFINVKNLVDRRHDIFSIESKLPTQAALDLSAAMLGFKNEKNLSLLTDDTTEVKYQPLPWYFYSILQSKIVLIHFLGTNVQNSFVENAKNSFFAGIAAGRGCKVLLLAPAKYQAPLDYHEIMVQYSSSEELLRTVDNWLVEALLIEETKNEEELRLEHENNLIKLGVGCEVAEHERESLLNYFVPTASYNAALRQDKSILVGRKGSGKTAICIKLLSELADEPSNYVVRLLPESEELLDDINMASLFGSSLKSFFVAVWKLVIFSKLAMAVFEKLKVKSRDIPLSDVESKVVEFVEVHEDFMRLNFFGVIKELSLRNGSVEEISAPLAVESLFKEYLSPLIKLLREYFSFVKHKYYKIIIIADNLDKTWDPKNDLKLQAEMILTLLEIEGKIKIDLLKGSESKVDLRHIVFLREDIFEYIRKEAPEPDKVTTMVHKIDWEKYPALLKVVIENRFLHILSIKDDGDVDAAWQEFFALGDKKHPFEIISEIITKRPRDLIYFVGRLFESAIDNDHHAVDRHDLQYAINSYTEFLYHNTIAETKAEFPEISEILSKLQEYHGEKIEYEKFLKILEVFNYSAEKSNALIESLFKKGYMIGFDDKTNAPFDDIEVLRAKLNERRLFFFKNKVYIIAHAKYYFIKNKISPI